MSFLEILMLVLLIALPLLLIYSAITEKTKPIFIFTIGYFICNLLNFLESIEYDFFKNTTEESLYDILFIVGRLLLFVFIAICIFSPIKLKWSKLLFYIPVAVLFIAFYLKTSNMPFRFYGMSYRVADFIEIMGILLLTFALTEQKSAPSKSK